MSKNTEAFLYVGLMIGFFIGLLGATYLLMWLWAPLAVIPIGVYVYFGVRYNARKCWCGHRYISHNAMANMCLRCEELTLTFHEPKQQLGV